MNKQALLDQYLQSIAEAEAEINEIAPEIERWRYERHIINRLLEKEIDEEMRETWRIRAIVAHDMKVMAENRLEELKEQIRINRAIAQEITQDIGA
jgi:hypothetical protein